VIWFLLHAHEPKKAKNNKEVHVLDKFEDENLPGIISPFAFFPFPKPPHSKPTTLPVRFNSAI